MAVNLASKYSKKIAEKYVKESFIAGNTNNDFDFVGAKTINIYTPQTVDLNDYDRTATANRFGTPQEMQDAIQELQLSQDKGFSITIDKGNNEDQMNTKGAAKMMKLQIQEKVTPYMDKYAFNEFSKNAGTFAGIAEPTKETIADAVLTGLGALDNALVPSGDRIIYLPVKYCNMIASSNAFAKSDAMAERYFVKGQIGTIGDAKVIKVPDSYMPESVWFIITHKKAVMMPIKIKTARILDNVMGIDGNVLEGRNYFDAFVLGAKAGGVYAAGDSSIVTDAPSVEISGHSAAFTVPASTKAAYTLDGTDPRYNAKHIEKTSGPATVATTTGQYIRVAYKSEVTGRWSAVTKARDIEG